VPEPHPGGLGKEGFVLRIAQRVAALDVIDAEFIKALCDEEFILHAEADTQPLGAVTQSGVVEFDPAGFRGHPGSSFRIAARGAGPQTKSPAVGGRACERFGFGVSPPYPRLRGIMAMASPEPTCTVGRRSLQKRRWAAPQSITL